MGGFDSGLVFMVVEFNDMVSTLFYLQPCQPMKIFSSPR
jgi:hypothetical protein